MKNAIKDEEKWRRSTMLGERERESDSQILRERPTPQELQVTHVIVVFARLGRFHSVHWNLQNSSRHEFIDCKDLFEQERIVESFPRSSLIRSTSDTYEAQ